MCHFFVMYLALGAWQTNSSACVRDYAHDDFSVSGIARPILNLVHGL
jgi:hypothetical protein